MASNWIDITGNILSLNFNYLIINIYNPCSLSSRANVWNEILDLCSSTNLPCLVIGDHNETLEPEDRGTQTLSSQGSKDFRYFIQNLGLMEVHASNGPFTWFRAQSKSKLDRLFVQSDWISSFPSLKLSPLRRGLCDYTPLLVCSTNLDWGPEPFRFLNCWLTNPQCMKIIKES